MSPSFKHFCVKCGRLTSGSWTEYGGHWKVCGHCWESVRAECEAADERESFEEEEQWEPIAPCGLTS